LLPWRPQGAKLIDFVNGIKTIKRRLYVNVAKKKNSPDKPMLDHVLLNPVSAHLSFEEEDLCLGN
jgi:hypothetical protein